MPSFSQIWMSAHRDLALVVVTLRFSGCVCRQGVGLDRLIVDGGLFPATNSTAGRNEAGRYRRPRVTDISTLLCI
jgi:hypothetical protein